MPTPGPVNAARRTVLDGRGNLQGVGKADAMGRRSSSQPATTARYAHLAADPVKALNDRIGATIGAFLDGQAGHAENVVPLKWPA